MKILFTGSTGRQTSEAGNKRRMDRINDPDIIVNSLRKNGFDVDRKVVSWGDDISHYDIAIIGLGAFGSMNYNHLINAIQAIGKAKRTIIFHEDWKIHETMKSFKTIGLSKISKFPTKVFANGKPFYAGTHHDDFNSDLIYNNIQRVISGEFEVIVPGYDWGDKNIVANILNTDVGKITNLDLSPYVMQQINSGGILNFDEAIDRSTIPSNRLNKYMLASLGDHTKWVKSLGLFHDVDYYGCKTLEAPILDSEKHVFDTMFNYWGILAPKYPHAGSGWFRIRFIYSALNRNITIMDKEDSVALGLKHLDKIPENASFEELMLIAEEQATAILKHYGTVEDFDNRVKNLILK